jgi:hypothetical protein
MTTVVQDWVSSLTWKQQTVLLASFRGCDSLPKNDPSKTFTKMMRATLLKDADPTSSFMPFDVKTPDDFVTNKPLYAAVDEFFIDCSKGGLDAYPVHWILHFLQAAEIVGYKHPDQRIGWFWGMFYQKGVKALHLNPETEEQLDARLADKVVVCI